MSHVFRVRDLRLHGKPDVNGVLSAKYEKMLASVEQFFDCILTGYIIRHLYMSRDSTFIEQPYITFWIMIDIIIMFLSLGFNYMS